MVLKHTDLFTGDCLFFNSLDTSNFDVINATKQHQLHQALSIRNAGYAMYFKAKSAKSPRLLKNETIYLALENDVTPVGTLRVLDERHGPIELEAFFKINSLLENWERPCAEATRFTVPNRHPQSLSIKLLLWISFFRYCEKRSIKTMLISSRPIYARQYTFLGFEDVGDIGQYQHPHLKNKIHRTFKLFLPAAKEKWIRTSHPLWNFFF
jgi:hypothetical protein